MEKGDRPSGSIPDEGRYRLLVDAITDYAIYMLDAEGTVSSWNPGAERFKGYSAPEILGQHFSRFYTDEDREAGVPWRALETAAREGRFETEGWRVRKDGTRFWAHVVIDPIREPSGDLIGYAKITRDLTERKIAQEALKQSEERFRLLVQGVTDYAIYMLDPEGRISNWNTGAERLKGYRPDEVIGLHFSTFYTDEDRAAGLPQRGLEAAARVGRFEKEGWRIRKDGTRFWANVVIDPIRDENGVILGYAKVTRDITERMQTQKALEQAREALFQSQKMEAIGRLTGGIAHDFNNLLMAIMGSLELARKRLSGDPAASRLIDNAMQGAERGAALTQRMLAFARRQDLNPEVVDLPALVRGMIDLLDRSLGPTVVLKLDFPPDLDRVLADPNQLELALLNLAVNARDAMPGGGDILVQGHQEEVGPAHRTGLAPGRYVCLSLTDTGEGMDEETLQRAIEPFFTTKGIGKGTGLGLPMVLGMAEQSGGKLLLRSRKGEGTTAELWLPVSGAGQGAAGRGPPAAIRQDVARTPRLTVLAVDDDSLVLMNTAAMIEDLGHKALEAMSGREALEIVRSGASLDLVITDQAMPEMTGTELAGAIKSERPDLPIILATGYADWPAGSDPGLPRLAKPFRQHELAQALADAMGVPPAN